MYWAKQRAWSPVVIALPATSQVGRLTLEGSFASFASFAIAAGVMSAEPTIFSCLMLERTVEWPFTPIKMATAPNAIRIDRCDEASDFECSTHLRLPSVCGRASHSPSTYVTGVSAGCARRHPGRTRTSLREIADRLRDPGFPATWSAREGRTCGPLVRGEPASELERDSARAPSTGLESRASLAFMSVERTLSSRMTSYDPAA